MKFYYFGGNFYDGHTTLLENSHFDGVMFVYDSALGDVFTKMVENMKTNEKIKYLVAIRPYAISPQYLCMINQSMNSIMPDKLQINFVSGYIKEHEKFFGGILGNINDNSDRIERSNYLIDYIDVLNTMPGNQGSLKLDFYVSTTNEYVFKATEKYDNKIIISYKDYKNGYWTVVDNLYGNIIGNNFDCSKRKIMLAITPIIRKTQDELDRSKEYANRPIWREDERQGTVTDIEYFTYEEFDKFIVNLESKGIDGVLINGHLQEERENIISFVKQYKEGLFKG